MDDYEASRKVFEDEGERLRRAYESRKSLKKWLILATTSAALLLVWIFGLPK